MFSRFKGLGISLALLCVGVGLVIAASRPTAHASPISTMVSEARAQQPDVLGQIEEEHVAHDHAGHLLPDGRFTTQGEVWPPQYREMENVVDYSQVATARTLNDSRELAAADVTMESRDLSRLLGERFVLIRSAETTAKWEDESNRFRVTYYSYSNNQTVEAMVENDEIVSVKTFAASEKQPPLIESEVQASVEIARAYWLKQGHTEVNELEGFTIQQMPTDGRESPFFDKRMAYVTFHVSSETKPLLLTWIDLSDERIVHGLVDDGQIDEQEANVVNALLAEE